MRDLTRVAVSVFDVQIEDFDHVRRGHVANKQRADDGFGIRAQRGNPLSFVLSVLPGFRVLVDVLGRDIGKRSLRTALYGGHALGREPHRNRIGTLLHLRTVRASLFPCFGKRYRGKAAQPHLALLAGYADTKDPAPSA
jgi:hypothetical protein